MAKLDSRHHTLIQALLNRGPLHEREVKLLFKSLCGPSGRARERDFHDFIGNINRELDFLQLEARAGRNQYDGEVFYAIVNKVADDHSKLGTGFSGPQIAFFRAVMEAILQDSSGKGHISNIDALNLRLDTMAKQESQSEQDQIPQAFRQFTMVHKENTLRELIKAGWLSSVENGRIGLGTKAFIELRTLFRSFDVPFCDVCNEAGIKAVLCQNEACSVRMHEYCAKRKFERPQVSKVCPTCGTTWDCAGWTVEVPDLNETKPFASGEGTSLSEKRKRVESAEGTSQSEKRRVESAEGTSQSERRRLSRSSARLASQAI